MKKIYLSLLAVAFFAFSAQAQNVGIGQPSPTGKMDVMGNLIVGSSANWSGSANGLTNGAIIEGQTVVGAAQAGTASNTSVGVPAPADLFSLAAAQLSTYGDAAAGAAGIYTEGYDGIYSIALGTSASNAGYFWADTDHATSYNVNGSVAGTSWLDDPTLVSTSAVGAVASTPTGSAIFAINDGLGFEGYGAAVFGITTDADAIVGLTPGESYAGIIGLNEFDGPSLSTSGLPPTYGVLAIIQDDIGENVIASRGQIRPIDSEGKAVVGSMQAPTTSMNYPAGGEFTVAGTNRLHSPFQETSVGIRGTGYECGVYGSATQIAAVTDVYGGYFTSVNDATSTLIAGAVIGANIGGTAYKIADVDGLGGVVSTSREMADGNTKVLFASEAPSPMYEDYGHGQLVNGIAQINLDADYSHIIHVSNDKPLKVFIQLEGECNGVFVSNKTANGFTVKELANGSSNVAFTYHVIGHSKDADLGNGVVNNLQNVRFPVLPERSKVHKGESAMEDTRDVKEHNIGSSQQIRSNMSKLQESKKMK